MSAIESDYVKQAERCIQALSKDQRDRFFLTTSQLRNLMSLTAQIYDEAQYQTSEKIDKQLMDKVQYLRVRFVYQAGRERPVRELVDKGMLLVALSEIGDSREKLLQFCRYMEALVAYKKYHDRDDK